MKNYTLSPLVTVMPATSYQLVPSILLHLLAKDSHGQSTLEPEDVALFALLRGHAQGKGKCWPSLKKLSSYLGRSGRTVQRSLARLEAAGIIMRVATPSSAWTILLVDVKDGQVIERVVTGVTVQDSKPKFTGHVKVVLESAKTVPVTPTVSGGVVTSGQPPAPPMATKED